MSTLGRRGGPAVPRLALPEHAPDENKDSKFLLVDRLKLWENWPIYDGQRLCWYPSPGLQGEAQRAVGPKDWHREPCVLASSHLMRRRDRAAETG